MDTLPVRKNTRLKEYDYSSNGLYFITICAHNRRNIFGSITDGKIMLNEYGKIVESHIGKMNIFYDDVTVDKFVVMPNHLHLIIDICRERIVCVPQNKTDKTKMAVPKLIQIFKSAITKECRKITDNGTHTMRSLRYSQQMWQKSYHDHIIRDEHEYQKIWEYIDTNLLKWELDKYYTNN